MLVLSRKLNESIVINNGEITITIVEINKKDGKVRLAIDAPRNVPVHRSEVQRLIDEKLHTDAATDGGTDALLTTIREEQKP